MGSGVPMGNAIEEVKMIADYICCIWQVENLAFGN